MARQNIRNKPLPDDDLDRRRQIAADINAIAIESEERLKALAARLPGGDAINYIPVLCDFIASEYGWGLDEIAGLDNAQMTMFVEQALQRLEHARPAVDETATVKPAARHSLDFRFVHWYGDDYTFTEKQAAIVRLLWEEWKNGTPDVGGDTLLLEVDCETKRLDHLFGMGKHAAWKRMIRPGATQGSYRLAPPQGK